MKDLKNKQKVSLTMMMTSSLKEFFTYGEKVDGYDVRVLNEREARAAAGILFGFGLISLFNSVTLGHVIFTRFFIAFFTFDFLIRVIQPRYSPSLLMGRFFVQNQTPEYVGATQKRFAWGLGLALAIPMFNTIVVEFVPNPIKVVICTLCLVLLFLESAFSICLGCKLYSLFSKKEVTNCPGGVCEVRAKESVQKFSIGQKVIVSLAFLFVIGGVYMFLTKVQNKTFLGKRVEMLFMSDKELKAIEEAKFQKEADEFDKDDDF